MVLKKRRYSEMVRSAIQYLSNSTDVTYFSQGSVAKSMVETTLLEISRLQNYVTNLTENAYLSTASGYYLDLFGEMLGLPRINNSSAIVSVGDNNVKFFVRSGTLGSKLPHPTNSKAGLVPAGTILSSVDGTVKYEVSTDVEFPINAQSAYVPVHTELQGTSGNVGANRLTVHSLGISDLLVTNERTISTGSDIESDEQYRYRLSKAMSTRFGATSTAVQIAANSQPGVSFAELIPFARGAGTFDVLLIPRGNKLTEGTRQNVQRSVARVAPFGVNFKVREPDYLRFKLIAEAIPKTGVTEARLISLRNAVQASILDYLANISLGGEIVMNQIRSAVLSTDEDIKDVRIHEICINGRPRILRNYKLRNNELVVPDDREPDPIKII